MDAAFDSNGTFYARSLAANGMHSCPKNYERPFLLPAFFRFFVRHNSKIMKHLTVSELSAKSNDFFCIVVVVASEKPRLAPQKFGSLFF